MLWKENIYLKSEILLKKKKLIIFLFNKIDESLINISKIDYIFVVFTVYFI